ncbi:MAG: DUF2892 domain-containing protein [Nitrospirota bacterium]|jgi:hypothetical protein
MTFNLGKTERGVRLGMGLIGMVVAVFFLESPVKWVVLVGAIGVTVTSLIGFCPFWAAVGITTKKSCDIKSR